LLGLPVPAPQAAAQLAASGQTRPNFLFLFSDDQTFRALGRARELEVRTPHLDRLAERGLTFTHCFNQGGWSGAVCIPSRTMLNTGRTLWQSRGSNGQGLAPGAVLWGEALGRAGYDTFMAGKWHLPEEALTRSFRTLGPLTGGFLPSTTNGGAAYHRPAPGNSWTPDDPKWGGHWLTTNGQTLHSSALIADAAIDYLKTAGARGGRPFFMYIAFNAPHDPRQAPGAFLDLYPTKSLKLPPNWAPRHPFPIEAGFNGRDEILAPYPRTRDIIRIHLQEYYAIITHLDAQIGRILAALDSSGQAANTVVIFTSDQGLAVGQHGLLGKQNLYDHSLRVPFIIAGPGIPRSKRCEALVHLQSLFATTCEMGNVPVPSTVQFPSLVPLVTGKKRQLHEALYAAFLDRQRAVRTERWKLIRTPMAGQVQLFDVKHDPWETRNLAGDPRHAATRARLDAKLRELMRELRDPLPEAQVFTASRPRLSDAHTVQFGGALGEAYQRGEDRLSEEPYRSAAYLRSDFSFETNRVFVNYSGDISGRFIQLASLLSPPGRMTPATLSEVLRDVGGYQKADGHFGRDVDWDEPLEPENSNARLLPIFWGNSRLLLGLLEAQRAFDRPELLKAARRLGDFYVATAGRFLDPARQPEYRMTGSYAAGYVTDYFPGLEGLARLYQTTQDPRYLQQAERMAEFFRRFDTLPIDHSHGNLVTHCGLLLLHEITGKPEYLERPRHRWQQAIDGGYVWPLGGVGEKFRVSHTTDEGCSEADWLRLNLSLWRLTGDHRCLEMAERLLWNHYAMNRTANGGYGHHNFVADAAGPRLMKPEFTEAVWCCTFHGLLGLHTLKSYVVTGSDRGVLINFPLPVSALVATAEGEFQVTVTAQEQPGSLACSVQLEPRSPTARPPEVRFRVPAWAERTRVTNRRGAPQKAPAAGGYLQLPAAVATECQVTFECAPRVEDRRFRSVQPDAKTLTRHRGVTICDGPHLLLANTGQVKPALVAVISKDGRLRLPRGTDGGYRCVGVPDVDAAEPAMRDAARNGAVLSLLPWEQVRHDGPVAFVFDLIVVPEESPLAQALKP
jgi:choline-sulfatase